ncbi:MAG: hypothetical protein M3Z26_00435 [Bacteroidota bacterium]|nr:hypothetical protein [Bacteroidota bacterium]
MLEIKCPKCQSTQVIANKKGFSGGKAVGGAIITGGIGLLAGTIGSNKIKITCLSCGYQFNPGETFESLNKKRQIRKSRLWFNIAIILIVFGLFKSCLG